MRCRKWSWRRMRSVISVSTDDYLINNGHCGRECSMICIWRNGPIHICKAYYLKMNAGISMSEAGLVEMRNQIESSRSIRLARAAGVRWWLIVLFYRFLFYTRYDFFVSWLASWRFYLLIFPRSSFCESSLGCINYDSSFCRLVWGRTCVVY